MKKFLRRVLVLTVLIGAIAGMVAGGMIGGWQYVLRDPPRTMLAAVYLGVTPEYAQAFRATGAVLPPQCNEIPEGSRVPHPWTAETPSEGLACFAELVVNE